jgi:hypothetical protein
MYDQPGKSCSTGVCSCRAVDTPEFAAALRAKGYTQLVIQKGAGEYLPCKLLPAGAISGEHASGLRIE